MTKNVSKNNLINILKSFKTKLIEYCDTKVSTMEEVQDLSSQITQTDIKQSYVLKLQKLKRMINFRIDVTTPAVDTYTIKLGTIPPEFVPSPKITINTISNKGIPCYFFLDADGTFGMTLTDATSKIQDGDGIRESLVYFI